MSRLAVFISLLMTLSDAAKLELANQEVAMVLNPISIDSIEPRFVWQHKETIIAIVGMNLDMIASIQFGDADCEIT